jgi:hypothetical protein
MKKLLVLGFFYAVIGVFLFWIACAIYPGAPFDQDEIEVVFTERLDDKKGLFGDSYDMYRTDGSSYKYIVIDNEWLDCCGDQPTEIQLNKSYKIIVSVDGAHTWKDFWTFGYYDYIVETFVLE